MEVWRHGRDVVRGVAGRCCGGIARYVVRRHGRRCSGGIARDVVRRGGMTQETCF